MAKRSLSPTPTLPYYPESANRSLSPTPTSPGERIRTPKRAETPKSNLDDLSPLQATLKYYHSPKRAADSSLPAAGSSRRLFDESAAGSSLPAAGSSLPVKVSSQFTPMFDLNITPGKDPFKKFEEIFSRYITIFKDFKYETVIQEGEYATYFFSTLYMFLNSFVGDLTQHFNRELTPEDIRDINEELDVSLTSTLRSTNEYKVFYSDFKGANGLNYFLTRMYNISRIVLKDFFKDEQYNEIYQLFESPLRDISNMQTSGGSKSKKVSKKKSKKKSKRKSKKSKRKSKRKSKKSK